VSKVVKGSKLMIPTQVVATPCVVRVPPHQFSLFYRVWPVAVLGVALIFNVVWMGFLGFEFFKLVF
jgi:hypothetical protein